jgi:hypothetical protein
MNMSMLLLLIFRIESFYRAFGLVYLSTGAGKHAEQTAVLRGSEDIAVNQLPTRLFFGRLAILNNLPNRE